MNGLYDFFRLTLPLVVVVGGRVDDKLREMLFRVGNSKVHPKMEQQQNNRTENQPVRISQITKQKIRHLLDSGS